MHFNALVILYILFMWLKTVQNGFRPHSVMLMNRRLRWGGYCAVCCAEANMYKSGFFIIF